MLRPVRNTHSPFFAAFSGGPTTMWAGQYAMASLSARGRRLAPAVDEPRGLKLEFDAFASTLFTSQLTTTP